ncbi:MAG: MFS general substrate transporter [Lasallia pustulata]|uniref:MFS general substrate transporter n=1 Tax=Lasallia pustulata TaxID=136370 RepID=A0A5M8PEK9_9LECA|nr:MAG: MFS general substrate transporter [Lasallia pustulata]
MAEPIPQVSPVLSQRERYREELAFDEGHDADFPTNEERSIPEQPSSRATTEVERDRDHDFEVQPEKNRDLEAGAQGTSAIEKGLAEATPAEPVDPNVVSWDGPDDPAKPLNWPEKRKWSIIAIISSITFLTPLASSMFAPGIPQVMKDFHSTNEQLSSFAVSVYILGYAFGPLLVAPLSELYGRMPVYQTCNVLFVIFTVACAVSSNLNMLIAFRFFEGCVGSAPLTLGGGTIADMIVQEKRGGAMAIFAMGPLLGPVIGPVAGGFLTQAKGWRWVFWVIAIVGGAASLFAIFALRETYPPVLLERKASRLRKETGNASLRSKLDSGLSPRDFFKRSIVRPARMLIFSPIVLAMSVFMAVVYGYMYLLFTTITEVFEDGYHFSQGTVGLTYLGLGVGMIVGLITFGFASDRIVKKKSAKGEMKPEYRLPPMIPGAFFIPAGLFWYGWSAQYRVHWISPIMGTSFVGIGMLATFMPIQTYLVDAYTIHAASAIAASAVLRSLVGAILPLAGQKMYSTLGLGWGNSLLAFIALALCPIPWVFLKYGERIRTSPRFRVML